ncbi:MAG: DUF2961 domain-containing protein [Deltaproteobacteria bacterium]|nr:DUF2961 domain-containing protein [Deltaproteobacteria bacterium]
MGSRCRVLVIGCSIVLGICGGCGDPTTTPEAQPTRSPPIGLAALTDLVALAELRPPGQQTWQVSSYDRTGHNFDFGVSATDALAVFGSPIQIDNSFLYEQDGRFVIFDDVGPGVVDRIWMTDFSTLIAAGLNGDIAFEFDDETTPRLTLGRNQLFGGSSPPFVFPLVGNDFVSSGGFFSEMSIVYAHRLRITTSVIPNYLNITYTRLPPDRAVESSDLQIDAQATAQVLAAVGTDPKALEPSVVTNVALNVAAGSQQTIWDHAGPGTVLRFELFAPRDAEIPTGLRLQAWWDGASLPQVDAPLDDFFGAPLGPAARSLAFGRVGDRFYIYFTMPFWRSAHLVLRNDGDSDFHRWTARISAVEQVVGSQPGYLHASSNAAQLSPGTPDYPLLETSGTGQIVGVVLTAGCSEQDHCKGKSTDESDGLHLEGDEHIAFDGNRYPQIHGTGLEDFFNGGFYFLHGTFTLPTHGNPATVASSPRRPGFALRSAYRLFLADSISFANGIRVAIEHGPTNDVGEDLSSLVFFYSIPEATLFETDRMVLDSGESEAAHQLVATNRQNAVVTSVFRGDDHYTRLTASGFTATSTRFRVAVDPANRGVRLQRLADIRNGRQSAVVRVNGEFAGIWSSVDINANHRWAELNLEIPAALTAGRETLDVEIDANASLTPWTAFAYSCFSHLPVSESHTQHRARRS